MSVQVAPDLVVFGNLLLDDIVRVDGTTRMAQPGGAVLYSALAARLHGIRVGVVSVVGEDYPSSILQSLEERGIELALRRRRGPSLRTWLLDEGRQRQVVHRLAGPSHDDVTPGFDDLPTSWRGARAFHLAPMPQALQGALAASLADLSGDISLDPYDLLRSTELPAWRRLLATVDTLLISEDEVMLGDGAGDVLTSFLDGGRLRHIVFKQGDQGGILWTPEITLRWQAEATSAVDTTGAGDAFAAGFLAAQLRREDLPEALLRGAVTAALAIGGEGPQGLLAARQEDLERRLAGRPT